MTVLEKDAAAPDAGAPTSSAARARKRLSSPWASLAALVIAVLWTIPTFGLLLSSFRPEQDVRRTGWWTFFANPGFTFDNYAEVLFGGSQPLVGYFVNSVLITIPSVVIPIVLATLAAYGFAWTRFPFRDALFVAIVALAFLQFRLIRSDVTQ
jgi:alpha-glucoside transport system permease protein